MEPWTLFFWVIFANGQQAFGENENKFETKSACYLVAYEKAQAIQMELWKQTGMPVQVRHRCALNDTPT